MSPTMTVDTPNETEIVLTREFDAPRELVWEAMTNPEHIRQWWGWRHWTVTTCENDLRPGGRYRYVATSPEGQEVPMTGTNLEIVKPDRIVFTEIYDVAPFNEMEPARATTVFEDLGGNRTRITVTATYPSREIRDAVLESGMDKGAAHSYDRLAELLTTLS